MISSYYSSTMTIDDIPSWLHDSILLETLLENRHRSLNRKEYENFRFSISYEFVRDNDDIHNLRDFIDVARIVDYWQLNIIPESMLYAVQNDTVSYDDFLSVKEMFPCWITWSALEPFSRKSIENEGDLIEAFDAIKFWKLALDEDVPEFILEFEEYITGSDIRSKL